MILSDDLLDSTLVALIESKEVRADFFIDAVNWSCPMPLLKTKAQLYSMGVGDVLCIKTSDPGSKRDISSYISLKKYKLLKLVEVNRVYSFWIEKC